MTEREDAVVTFPRRPDPEAARQLLRKLAPSLANRPLDVHPVYSLRDEWCRAPCVVDRRWMLKFCWAEAAAAAMRRQTGVIDALTELRPELPIAPLVASSREPAGLLYEMTPGRPLTWDDGRDMTASERETIADAMANFLVALHEPALRDQLRARDGSRSLELGAARAQATSAELRTRLVPRLTDDLAGWLAECLDWVDQVHRRDAHEPVLVHGDFHGFNQVYDNKWKLAAVLDFEESAWGQPEYDLRYLPRQAPTLDLLDAVVAAYNLRSKRQLHDDAIYAWHVLTDLGDAMWRDEAAVEVVAGPIERRAGALRELIDTRR